MRKTLLWLISAILFSTLPALAQRGQHQQSRENHNFGVRQRGNGERPNVGVRQRGNDPHRDYRRQEQRPFERDDHAYQGRGYNWSHGGRDHREHWDGRRFDDHYFRGHWGREHRFYWGHCNWYGPRFFVGSYFWYNDAYFVIVEQVPGYWNDEEIYVEYVDGYGYALVNPMYPGVYYHVDVRF